MKLIYAYIKKFRNIVNQEIYFSDAFMVKYNHSLSFPDALIIQHRLYPVTSSPIFKDSKLSNVHIVVGKTGAGKTNIFQMIGMPEEERIDEGGSYFLLYTTGSSFVIEPFNIPIDSAIVPHRASSQAEKQLNENLKRMPAYVQQRMAYQNSMSMYKFIVNEDGNVKEPRQIVHPDELGADITFIFNGYERHAFPFCPYEENRFETVYSNTIWQTRVNAEYHKTKLFCSCRFLKEYIDTFDPDNIKRKASLVIKAQNWAGTIKQHINERLEAHDYWTFIGQIRQDNEDRMLGKTVKERKNKKPAIRHQFVHDLWADYALYLRKWISYIQMWPNEVNPENLDASGTVDVFQEAIDYWYEKKAEDEKNPIDPTILPDFENLSILKRLKWLAMWIDRRSDRKPYSLLYQIADDIKDIGDILGKFDDRYFTNDTFTLPIDEMYTAENKQLVEDLFERMEQYIPDDTGIFTEELLPYYFSCISSGEYQLAKVLGGIEEYCVKLSVGKYGNHPHLIYLLDEPATYMHPELCRMFMKRLDDVLQERTGEADIQVLISTHSPFLLSDVLPQQVTRLDMDGWGYCVIKKDTGKPYFGANIHTVLADGFFLNYTIGEFARTYLQDRFDWLKGLLKKGTLSDEDKNEIRSLKTVIPLIGDSIIRKSFEMLLHQVEAHYDQD